MKDRGHVNQEAVAPGRFPEEPRSTSSLVVPRPHGALFGLPFLNASFLYIGN